MNPDLKLGMVLVAAAVLLALGAPGNFLVTQAKLLLEPSAASYGLLIAAGGVGGLAVIAAAIWVDRRPPHAMMAAGALAALLGLSVLALPASFVAFAVGLFVGGVGSSAVNPLIFYAIAVKGASRYRGTIIGALGMVFLLSPGRRGDIDWQFGESALFIPVIAALTLAGTALLFVALPRVFTGAYESDQTQQVKPGAPGVWRALLWVTIAFSAAALASTTIVILPYQIAMNSSSELLRLEPEVPTASVFQAANAAPVLHAASAAGVLLWGVASDFFALRRWLLLTAILFVLGAGGVWVFGSPLGPTFPLLAVGLARGGLVCLPLILMAELLPTRHFAKLALLIQFVSIATVGIPSGLLLVALHDTVPLISWALVLEAFALAILAAFLPRATVGVGGAGRVGGSTSQ